MNRLPKLQNNVVDISDKLKSNSLVATDLAHTWHPCMQMQDTEQLPPMVVDSAEGSYLYLANGKHVIDATSSWWCKSLGHNHPELKQALIDQANSCEHVMLANTTNVATATLSLELAKITPNLTRCFYASDGACAVEIAMKMSLQARKIQGQKRHKFMALANGYHGETMLALSASDLGLYKLPFEEILLDIPILQNIPYVNSTQEPLWDDCSAIWPQIEAQLNIHAETLTAIVLEPILQGACGMRLYSRDFLKRLRAWTVANDVHLIVDEILTGIGRTGHMLAIEYADIEADFLCLGKGLTSGWLPLSVTLTSDTIYNLFYDDYSTGKAFLHSHTYCGNPLAANVALACLRVMQDDSICDYVQEQQELLLALMHEVSHATSAIKNVRGIGFMAAAELIPNDNPRRGFAVMQQAIARGALIRPIGNTVYWLPPLTTEIDTLHKLMEITIDAINAT